VTGLEDRGKSLLMTKMVSVGIVSRSVSLANAAVRRVEWSVSSATEISSSSGVRT